MIDLNIESILHKKSVVVPRSKICKPQKDIKKDQKTPKSKTFFSSAEDVPPSSSPVWYAIQQPTQNLSHSRPKIQTDVRQEPCEFLHPFACALEHTLDLVGPVNLDR